MKSFILIIMLFFPALILAQGFNEICPGETTNGTIVNFESFEGEIYATGFFSQICSETTNYVAKWNGSGWESAGFSLTDPGHSFTVSNDTLFIARYEESIDSNWVYYYHNQTLSKLGEGVYLTSASGFSNLPNIYDIAIFQNKIIACGEFDRVGNQSISGIMQWNGSQWTGLASGISGNIPATAPVMFPHQMVIHNDQLFVAGNFRLAGGVTVNGIAMWDGENWHALGDGFNSTVYGIGIYNDQLYAGGDFTQSGTTPLNRIARWNGTEWESPGFGFIPLNGNDYAFIHTLKEIDGQLMIAGGLKQIQYDDQSTESCGGIVAFDGTQLETFDGGVAGNDIEAVIKTNDDRLLVGGGVFNNGYSGILDMSTSISQVDTEENFINIYPNPSTNMLNIELPGGDFHNFIIRNAQGRQILEKQIHSKFQTINTSHLPEGLYFISFYRNGDVVSEWFSVVR